MFEELLEDVRVLGRNLDLRGLEVVVVVVVLSKLLTLDRSLERLREGLNLDLLRELEAPLLLLLFCLTFLVLPDDLLRVLVVDVGRLLLADEELALLLLSRELE